MTTNRYAEDCYYCHDRVEPGEGRLIFVRDSRNCVHPRHWRKGGSCQHAAHPLGTCLKEGALR
jgi:hypothetical protein